MLRKLVVAFLAASALAVPARADPVTLLPGVTYDRHVELTAHGPVVIHVVSAPPPGGLLSLQVGLSNEAIVGSERLTALERRLAPTETTLGIAADFARPDGRPLGMVMRAGALEHAPLASRTSAIFDSAGALHVGRTKVLATWEGSGPRRFFNTVNDQPPANGVALFTPSWGPKTPPLAGGFAAVLLPFGPLVPGTPVSAQVVAAGAESIAIPPGGAVLLAHGVAADYLESEAPVGVTVTIRSVLSPEWTNAQLAVGGGPELVRNGVAVFRPVEGFDANYLAPRAARAAIGQRADGSLLLVAVDGGRPGYSVGMTTFELAQTMVTLGAKTAYALAGKDAAALAFDGQLLSRPSGPAEQPVADALLIAYTGVYVPPPSAPVLSPNGDGVDDAEELTYRVVRPSSVNATLFAPDGSAVLTDQHQRDPGTYPLTWTGQTPSGEAAPEGLYRFVVAAVDDTGRETTMEQDFTLNLTLRGLTATAATATAPTDPARQVATFELTRPATVNAAIETAGGTVVRELSLGPLDTGSQPVYWDGRDDEGQPVYSGSYQVRVAATNELGRSELVVPLAVRRIALKAPRR